MKKILKEIIQGLISSKFTIILILILSIGVGVATFIENSHDTSTAKALVYNARWFEILLFLVVINLIGSIVIFKLYKKERMAGFIFHLGFIVMIIGAAVTRYIGFEGSMHIREGETSAGIFTSEPYFMLSSPEDDGDYKLEFKIDGTKFSEKAFEINYNSKTKGNVSVTLKDYIPNAVEDIIENVSDGVDMILIKYASNNHALMTYINSGEIKELDGLKISFNNNSDSTAVNIKSSGNELIINSPSILITGNLNGEILDSIQSGNQILFKENTVFQSGNMYFLLMQNYHKAKKVLIQGNPEENNADAIIADVKVNDKVKEIQIFGGNGFVSQSKEFNVNGLKVNIGFGNKTIDIPFSLQLNDFILERYPGSMSPSSFESQVTLIDKEKNISEKHRIFMNNILDYRGYRFFQSSYDPDEKGTVLSVSHDKLGAWITYISYIMLIIGFIMVFFSKKTRFTALRKEIKQISINKKTLMFLFILFSISGNAVFAQDFQKPVSKEHAEKLGHVVVQTFDGRFEPVHTLALDVIHKISKKNKIEIEGQGYYNAMQVFTDMMVNPEFWKTQKIISVKDESLRSFIGITGKYASFTDFFSPQGEYKLATSIETANRKEKGDKTGFDKEVIAVNERLNIFWMTTKGSMLKIFPEQESENHKWLSAEDSLAFMPITGNLKILNEDLNLKSLNYANIFMLYLQSVNNGKSSDDYSRADQILVHITNIQHSLTKEELLPSETKINTEIHYNKANIFTTLKFVYMILSVFLIFFAFVNHLSKNPGKFLRYTLNILIGILALAFTYHTYGLILRWYLSGHAPWSNGYETLVFVAWGGLFAGFVFMKYSKITLAATSLLAFFIMLTAGFSSYDPQLTNLQPVLKSYWLIIHVAVIVISYGFLGLGFVLGLINMFIYIFKNQKNAERLNSTIKELSYINEMNLTIGIFLATIGTFLGAVWANESWGRYWGWDAKETWALIIIMVYAIVLHLRLVPSLKGIFLFNASSVVAFGSVVMTFFGVNFYFTKGMHSYAQEGTTVFPLWGWVFVLSIITIISIAAYKDKISKKPIENILNT